MSTKKIKFKVITPKDLKHYQAGLLDLLKSEYNTPKALLRSLKNTSYIIIALDWDNIIWSNQIITDKLYVAFLINLWVNPEYRKYWIWWKIIEKTLKQAKKTWAKWIELVPDPGHPWLVDFYSKYWFNEWKYMYLRW